MKSAKVGQSASDILTIELIDSIEFRKSYVVDENKGPKFHTLNPEFVLSTNSNYQLLTKAGLNRNEFLDLSKFELIDSLELKGDSNTLYAKMNYANDYSYYRMTITDKNQSCHVDFTKDIGKVKFWKWKVIDESYPTIFALTNYYIMGGDNYTLFIYKIFYKKGFT